MQSIGIKFPFGETNQGGVIAITNTTIKAINSNLAAFFTMRKHNRVMHNDLYSPAYDYIFEQWDDISEDALKNDITNKVIAYFPEIKLNNITFNSTGNLIQINMIYTIVGLNITDNITIELPTTN